MSTISSFPPSVRGDARALLLGSMPGGVSLTTGHDDVHPRNLFWPIMGTLIAARRKLPRTARRALPHHAGIDL